MRFRELRIAWSVGCGTACLLLIALWVRSYWWEEQVVFTQSGSLTLSVTSGRGQFSVQNLKIYPNTDFRYSKSKATGPLAVGGWSYISVPNITWAVVAPYGFPVTLSAVLAGIPWLRSAKRFSLRTLLIVTTLVALVLGLIVYSSARPPAAPPLDQVDVPEF